MKAFVPFVFVLAVADAAKREDVVKVGTTMGPDFVRIEAKAAFKCPGGGRALKDGAKCCAKLGRPADPQDAPDCPVAGDIQDPLIGFGDPEECCELNYLSDCPGELCTSNSPEKSTCPFDYPFPIRHGLECCRYHLRGSSCPSGDVGTPLQTTDPPECCIHGEKVACGDVSKTCEAHDDADTFCGLYPSCNCRVGDIGFKDHGWITRSTAIDKCAEDGMILPVIHTQDRFDAVTALTGNDNSNPSIIWLGLNDTATSTCNGANCVGKLSEWYDGTPYTHLGSYVTVRLIHTSSIWNCPRLFFPSGSPTLEDYYCGYGQTGVCFAPSCVPDDP